MDLDYIIKIKLNDESIDDALITIVLEDIKLKILSYCNLKEVPDELKYVVVDIVVETLKYEKTNDTSNKIVKSITRGDVSINYADKKIIDKDIIFKSYIKILNGYRKLRK